MFKQEQFPLNTVFAQISVDATLEELFSTIEKERDVLVATSRGACLFTMEDLANLKRDAAATVGSFLDAHLHWLSPIVPYTDELPALDAILQHLPVHTNRPLLIKDEDGNIRGFSYVSALLQYAIREQQRWESYFTALAETVTDAVTVVDRNGEVICWNQVAEDLYNLPQSEILGRRIGEHFEQETLMVLKILDEGRMIRNTYHRPRPETHVLINASPIQDAQGQIIGGIATEQDITQLVRLNEQLTTQTFDGQVKVNTEDLFSFIKGKGPAIGKVVQWAKKAAATETPVLLIGETGAGKEQLAQIIHNASPRSERPFLAVNCGIVPAGLLETELFGFQGGAFTGNSSGQPGKLELAKDGTLFLNEIDRLSLDLQAKLYDYMNQQLVVRTGGNTPIAVRTRLIAASTQDLATLVEKQEFRPDLYYALNVITLRIPPLRERIEDIPAMLQMYLKQLSLQYQKPLPTLSPEVILAFTNYDWPGNLQELRNVVERCVILSDDDMITLDHLPPALQEQQPRLVYPDNASGEPKPKITQDDEIGLIQEALAKTAGNKSAAAKLLGISRGTLYNKMKENQME
ncbi:sigma-54 interaction domain-containing protein [Paenibacillus aestuarii]|uniref:Sigma-54 interaction domain-containing protein n=1 Tax=Paenibacillus aestuarii TaxID=516965 RepID=A0ABW0K6P9_9BACL|nr:sigma 54-interacting transcriptional regulator [Paenibacillus aestuarii]